MACFVALENLKIAGGLGRVFAEFAGERKKYPGHFQTGISKRQDVLRFVACHSERASNIRASVSSLLQASFRSSR